MQTSLDLFAAPARRHPIEYWIMHVEYASQAVPGLRNLYTGRPLYPDLGGAAEEFYVQFVCEHLGLRRYRSLTSTGVDQIPEIMQAIYPIAATLISDGFWIWTCCPVWTDEDRYIEVELSVSRWLAGERNTGAYAYQRQPGYLWEPIHLCNKSTPVWCNSTRGGTA